jgi:hypothetical protein
MDTDRSRRRGIGVLLGGEDGLGAGLGRVDIP